MIIICHCITLNAKPWLMRSLWKEGCLTNLGKLYLAHFMGLLHGALGNIRNVQALSEM